MPRDRPRLWESFKRALGSSPRESDGEPPVAPPFLPPDEALGAPQAALPAPVRPQTDAIAAASEPRARQIEAADVEAPDERPTPALSGPEGGGIRSPRLARGLASFSRDNADREKKFRHILSDGDSGRSKKP